MGYKTWCDLTRAEIRCGKRSQSNDMKSGNFSWSPIRQIIVFENSDHKILRSLLFCLSFVTFYCVFLCWSWSCTIDIFDYKAVRSLALVRMHFFSDCDYLPLNEKISNLRFFWLPLGPHQSQMAKRSIFNLNFLFSNIAKSRYSLIWLNFLCIYRKSIQHTCSMLWILYLLIRNAEMNQRARLELYLCIFAFVLQLNRGRLRHKGRSVGKHYLICHDADGCL